MSQYLTDFMSDLSAHLPAPPESLRTLFTERGTLVRASAGETVIQMGEVGRDVYLVAEGRVRFARMSESGREAIFSEARAGALFGEMAAIDGQVRAVEVSAVEDVRLYRIPASVFVSAVTLDPELAHWTMGLLAARVRDMTQRAFELSALSVGGRIVRALLRLAGPDADVITDFPTHEVFAAMVGTHREAVTRELRRLSKQGRVEQTGRTLRILDRAALEAI